HQYRFRSYFSIDQAATTGLGDRSLGPQQFSFDDQSVAWMHRFAELYFIGAHEIPDSAQRSPLAHQNTRYLSHGFQLQYSRHHRMTRKVPLKIRLINRDRLHPNDLVLAFKRKDAINQQERKPVR